MTYTVNGVLESHDLLVVKHASSRSIMLIVVLTGTSINKTQA